MSVLSNAKWVWIDDQNPDSYVDFPIEYDFNGKKTTLFASVDGYMSLKVNGELVPVTQYPDFPFYKSYETIDLTKYSQNGKNTAVLTVWHIGKEFQTYYPDKAGAIFELWQEDKVILASGESTLCQRTPGYKYAQCSVITSQLGFSFEFDANDCGEPYQNAVLVDKKVDFVPRPIKALTVSDGKKAEFIGQTGENTYLYDLGRETVGFVKFALNSPCRQRIMFTWSEHLVEGHARRKVGSHRDFSFFYNTKEGCNAFENRMLRFGLRYVEVYCEAPTDIVSVEVLPVDYPVNVLPYKSDSALIQRIYDTCVHTLRCCMHEHYEDCPWREQALYSMDSRNQMLSGYYAFGEYDYAEKNMLLLAKGIDENGFLPICAPTSKKLPIPSFSLAYLWSVDEFESHSGRLIDDEIFDAADKIISAFNKRLDESDNGLIKELEAPFWNFYEWSEGCGSVHTDSSTALLNMMYLIAYEKYVGICQRRNAQPKRPKTDLDKLRSVIRTTFLMKDGTYRVKCPVEAVSDKEFIPADGDFTNALVNSYAILSGVCDECEAKELAKRMIETDIPETTLSMKGFYYDALYKADSANSEYIMADICKNYGYMLDNGATTFWETIIGAQDFKYAGSLCHGWSALPIYYIHKFNK